MPIIHNRNVYTNKIIDSKTTFFTSILLIFDLKFHACCNLQCILKICILRKHNQNRLNYRIEFHIHILRRIFSNIYMGQRENFNIFMYGIICLFQNC